MTKRPIKETELMGFNIKPTRRVSRADTAKQEAADRTWLIATANGVKSGSIETIDISHLTPEQMVKLLIS